VSEKPTTIANNVGLELGMATVYGKLLTVRNTEKPASFRILCPTCLESDPLNGVAIVQQSTCIHGHGPFTRDECEHRGRQEGERLVPLSPEEVAAVKGEDVEGKIITLRFHPAEQVTNLNRPTGIVYHFEPGPGRAGQELTGALLDLITEGDLVIVGEVFVKKARRLFRFQSTPHGLELVEMARPEDVFVFEEVTYDYSDRVLHMVLALADALATDYDPGMYRNGATERLARVMAAKEAGEPLATVTAMTTAPAPTDLEAILAASLAAIQAKAA
jgi:non-homologous end joining protein Ku